MIRISDEVTQALDALVRDNASVAARIAVALAET